MFLLLEMIQWKSVFSRNGSTPILVIVLIAVCWINVVFDVACIWSPLKGFFVRYAVAIGWITSPLGG